MSVEYQKIGNLWVHPDYRQLLTRNNICNFDALLQTPGQSRLHKRGLATWRERVVLTLDSAEGQQRFYLKRYSHPPFKQQLNRLLAGYTSTAEIECHWLQKVTRLGIQVPVLIAFGTHRAGLREVNSLLLTAEIPGESLEKWLPRQLKEHHLDGATKRRLSQRLADLVARLHQAGLVHRDLYLSHIFVDRCRNGHCELCLLDLQRVIKPRWRLRRWVVKDLAALNYATPPPAASQMDRVRWLKSYLGTNKLSANDRALIRAVVRKTNRIAHHSAKHGLG